MKLTKTTKTFQSQDADQKWLLINADGKTLGRIATQIAESLRGKNKAKFTSNTDCGDFIVVINAEKVKLTGDKLAKKKYFHHSSYISGMKSISAGDLLKKNPEELIISAVKGMLPKTKLSDQLISKLKIYKGENHPHIAQKPINLEEKA